MAPSRPENFQYTKTHEWLNQEGDVITCGITDHAQEILSDVESCKLPVVGSRVTAGSPVAVLEAAKAVSDVHAPVSGEITAVNTELETHPGLINQDPFGKGWLFKLKPDTLPATDTFLAAEAYDRFITE